MDLLQALRDEKQVQLRGRIYHRLQVEMAYNSNHIEGSKLTEEQTRAIFETKTLLAPDVVPVDDIVETLHHFQCLDLVIDKATDPLSEELVKQLHLLLKRDTAQAALSWYNVGEYKTMPNEVGGMVTTSPDQVSIEMAKLIADYEATAGEKTLVDLLRFHVKFERIHPFQDGNGRVGRLLLLKECLRHSIVPFVITDQLKHYYYRGLAEWDREPGFLIGTAETGQDAMARVLTMFGIEHNHGE